ncbi:MAG: uracil-DNA glycosylase family protein, partial [Asgard group archaeon]|nr:uracil-DNA glycosylase family protein [Asgard group archaeon]
MNLKNCIKCIDIHEKFTTTAEVHVHSKPYLQYNTKYWIPDEVKILFLGEAPPFIVPKRSASYDSYFYNPDEKLKIMGAPHPLLGTISWNIFSLLGINNTLPKEEKLTIFREKGCFYTTAVKCRVERFNNKILSNRTIRNCSEHLSDQLSELQPEIIVAMGERALFALQCIDIFEEELAQYKLYKLIEKTLRKPMKINKQNLHFCSQPLWRNR